jgi:hypothetical protein
MASDPEAASYRNVITTSGQEPEREIYFPASWQENLIRTIAANIENEDQPLQPAGWWIDGP